MELNKAIASADFRIKARETSLLYAAVQGGNLKLATQRYLLHGLPRGVTYRDLLQRHLALALQALPHAPHWRAREAVLNTATALQNAKFTGMART